LIIRAVNDEASLAMALGTLVNYAAAKAIVFMYAILVLAFSSSGPISLSPEFYGKVPFQQIKRIFITTDATIIIASIMLFGLLMVSRAVHGRELALSPMECQINTQSTPDAMCLARIVTLVRRTYVKSLRHGIYDHEDCAKTISDWVHSQLHALPAK
jgi:hypothetical protein